MSKLWAGGTVLSMSDMATTPTFAAIAQVIGITPPALTLDTEDVTDNDSKNGWEEVIGTILRSGEVGLNVHMDPAESSHTDLMTAMVNRKKTDFKLGFPDGTGTDSDSDGIDDDATTWEFSALVTGFEIDEAAHDGKLTASITLKVTGEPIISGVNDI